MDDVQKMPARPATPSEEYATDAEVEAAVCALSPADRIRLAKVARFRARNLAARGGDDLLQQAILLTLDGTKRWRKSVKFVTHLILAIKNIAFHARTAPAAGKTVRLSVVETGEPGDGVVAISHTPDSESTAAMGEQFAMLEKTFETDDEVGLVMECMANGMTGPEIQQDLNITQTRYETIMRRLRRGVDRENGWHP